MQLDEQSVVGLKESLVGSMLSRKGSTVLLTQLCLGLSALAVRCDSVSWSNPVEDMCNLLSNDSALLVEFLTVLPDECYESKFNIPYEILVARRKVLLKNNANTIFNFLLQLMDSSLKPQILNCMCKWLYHVQDTQIVNNFPIIQVAFDSLMDEELFDPAADLVCELLAWSAETVHRKDLMELLMSKICVLVPLIQQSIADEQTERVFKFAVIVVEAAEAFNSLAVDNFSVFVKILEPLLLVTTYKDYTICQMTTRCWSLLCEVFLQRKFFNDPLPIIFNQLITFVVSQLEFPPDETQQTAEERDYFKDFRHEIGDCLKACCTLMGSVKAISVPVSLLHSRMNSSTWQQIEAPIFALRTMAQYAAYITDRDTILQILQVFLRMPNHHQNVRLRYACILGIGAYADWLKVCPEYLEEALKLVVESLEFPETVSASSLTLKYLCQSCESQLVNQLNALCSVYSKFKDSFSFVDELEVIEGLCGVFSATNDQSQLNEFFKLILRNINSEPRLISESLLKLSITAKHLRMNDISNIFQGVWQVMQSLSSSNDASIIDSWAECLKHFILYHSNTIKPFLSEIGQVLIKMFSETQHPHLMSCVRAIIRDKNPESRSLSQSLVIQISNLIFPQIQIGQTDSASLNSISV